MKKDPKIELIQKLLSAYFQNIFDQTLVMFGQRSIDRETPIRKGYIEFLISYLEISEQDVKDIEQLFFQNPMGFSPKIAARIAIEYLLTTDYFTV